MDNRYFMMTCLLGRRVALYVPYISTVEAVKTELQKEAKIHPSQQQLMYNNKPLVDRMTLKDAKIPFGSFLILKKLPTVIVVLPDGTICTS